MGKLEVSVKRKDGTFYIIEMVAHSIQEAQAIIKAFRRHGSEWASVEYTVGNYWSVAHTTQIITYRHNNEHIASYNKNITVWENSEIVNSVQHPLIDYNNKDVYFNSIFR